MSEIKNLWLSIIIPAYNAEKYIAHLLDTFTQIQSDDFEVIVVDDGSTDKTPEIVDRIHTAGVTNHIILIKSEHKGVSHARNLALSKAQGEYVWFVDADDELVHFDQIKTVEKKHSDLIRFNYEYELTNQNITVPQLRVHSRGGG